MILTFLDIETTGFDFLQSDLLQLGFVRADEKGKIINAGNLYYYQPEFNVEEPGAQAVHGITRDFLVPYEQDFEKNCAALWTILQRGYIVGKNSDRFDIPYIKGWLTKKFPGMLPTLNVFKTVDIQKVVTWYYRDWYYKEYGTETRKNGTLEEYVNMFGIQDFVKQMYTIAQGKCSETARSGFHDALYDSVATYCVWLIAREKNLVEL